MKRLFLIILAIAIPAMALVSCKKGDSPKVVSCTTLDATDITEDGATIRGEVKIKKGGGDGVKLYFYVSKSKSDVTYYLTDPLQLWRLGGWTVDAEDNTGKSGSFSAKITGLWEGTTIYYAAIAQVNGETMQELGGEVKSFTTVENPIIVPEGAVDLGVVFTREDGSRYRLFWAEKNLGASSPEKAGDYYAWGETDTKTDYAIDNYKWAIGGDERHLTKYCTLSEFWYGTGPMDNKTILETGPDGDDAASKILGDKWRIPTVEEWETLIEKCSFTYNSTKNGFDIAGPSGSIFLPCAGYMFRTSLSTEDESHYWSSTLHPEYQNEAMIIRASDQYGVYMRNNHRYHGHPIRPVTE